MFIAFSAVSLFIVGLLIVACSSDTNDLAVVPQTVKRQAPQDLSSESDWADFYAKVEALNAKYATQNRSIVLPGIGLHDELTEFKQLILVADAAGTQLGWEGATNGINSLTANDIMAMATATGAYRSYIALPNPDTTDITITLRDLHTIADLKVASPCVTMAKRHNQLLGTMMGNNYSSTGKSQGDILLDFIHGYEQLFGISISNSNESSLVNYVTLARTPSLTNNVINANHTFQEATISMSMATMRNYTDEYLGVVAGASLDAYDKMQMSIYASVMYYSNALWIVQ